jgi:hypothetical protein
MFATGFFGKELGNVMHAETSGYLGGKTGYLVSVDDKIIGAATDFQCACDMLMEALGVFKTEVVK